MPRESWDFPPKSEWEPEWLGSGQDQDRAGPETEAHIGMVAAWSPYVIVAALLVIAVLVAAVLLWPTNLLLQRIIASQPPPAEWTDAQTRNVLHVIMSTPRYQLT